MTKRRRYDRPTESAKELMRCTSTIDRLVITMKHENRKRLSNWALGLIRTINAIDEGLKKSEASAIPTSGD